MGWFEAVNKHIVRFDISVRNTEAVEKRDCVKEV
jgi:hypothetical protein